MGSKEVVVVEGLAVEVAGRVDEVKIRAGVEEMVKDRVEGVGIDESTNVTDVDDSAGGDEIVAVELVNLLSAHGGRTTPSCLILSPRLSGPAADTPDSQRRSKKRNDIRIWKIILVFFGG